MPIREVTASSRERSTDTPPMEATAAPAVRWRVCAAQARSTANRTPDHTSRGPTTPAATATHRPAARPGPASGTRQAAKPVQAPANSTTFRES